MAGVGLHTPSELRLEYRVNFAGRLKRARAISLRGGISDRSDRGFPDGTVSRLWPVFAGHPLDRMLHEFAGVLAATVFP